MWEIETKHFHDFWILGLVGTIIYGFEYTKTSKKVWAQFQKILFWRISRFPKSTVLKKPEMVATPQMNKMGTPKMDNNETSNLVTPHQFVLTIVSKTT